MLETLVRHLDMVRLTAAFGAVVAIGCTGLIEGSEPTKQELANKLWVEKAKPALTTGTCFPCHDGSRAGIGFLAGADDVAVRSTLLAYDPPAINLDAPQSSRLLTKGTHEGPALDGGQKSDIQEWVQAEKEAQNDGGGGTNMDIRTQDFTIAICTGGETGSPTCPVNELPLDDLGNGLGIAGAKISFVAQGVGSGLYLNNLKLVPGAGGAYIEHPLFVSIPTDPAEASIADAFDRFFNVKMNLQMGATAEEQQIQGGAAAFVNFPPQNKLAVFFKDAKLFQPDDGGGGGGTTGCKKLTEFEANARASLNTNCGSCHGGGQANAVSALDMTGINQANATNACNQVRLRVNFQAIDQSGIFLATTPGNNNHPFTFGGNAANHTAFKNALNPWIVAERDAP